MFYIAEKTLTLTIHVQHEEKTLDEFETKLRYSKDRQSNEILKIGFAQGGLQSFISVFESCFNDFCGEGAMQKLKTCDYYSYIEMIDSVLKFLESDPKRTNIRIRFPISIIDDDSSFSSFKKAIDMSVHAGKIQLENDKLIWDKEDFQNLFDKPVKRIIQSFMEVPSRDMDDIQTIIMFGTLAECPLVENAVKKSFSSKQIVVLTDHQVKSGAVYIGNIS